MTKIVGVRFQKAGKIYYFDPVDFDLETAMHVIVETAWGVEMGTVLIAPKEVEDDKVIQPLKPIIRIATDDDEKTVEKNKEKEKEAFVICKEKILHHQLEMKLVKAEYTFDSNKLLFYFTADGRIDFRELVKDLAAIFRTRIELRQIGVRDETKMMGGIGICGRELCCKSYLSDFVPVSIKMAKEQNLSLNPTKISGVCGRLMCCLKNEQETYEYLNSRLPSVGDVVATKSGMKGEVMSVNVLRQFVKLIVDNGEEKELKEVPINELSFRPKRHKDVKITEEELKELEGLEDVEIELIDERAEGKKDKNRDRNRKDRKEYKDYKKKEIDKADKQESSEFQELIEPQELLEFQEEKSNRKDRNNRRKEREDRTDRDNRNERENHGNSEGRDNWEDNEENINWANSEERKNRTDNENRGNLEDQNECESREEHENKSEYKNRGNRENRGNHEKKNDHENKRNRKNQHDKNDRDREINKEYNGRNRNFKRNRNFDKGRNRKNKYNDNRQQSDSE